MSSASAELQLHIPLRIRSAVSLMAVRILPRSSLPDCGVTSIAMAAPTRVNVIKIIREKGKTKLVGYNSDIIGFTQSIEPLLESQHKKALILGTGGASKAIFHGLKKLGLEAKFVSRKAQEGMLTYQELTPAIMEEYKVIVNCSPVGMYPRADEFPDIPYECLTPNHLLYDLLYNPDTTLFMKKGADKGAVVKNGLEMLLLQAFGAWDIWNK